jgi:hypothetical protein
VVSETRAIHLISVTRERREPSGVRATRLIREVRVKRETCERRETRNPRDVSESADTSAARTHDGMVDAQGGSNGVGIGGNIRIAKIVSSL